MLLENFIVTAKNNFNKIVLKDSTGLSLTYGQTLAGCLLLSKHISSLEGDNIAILFPASVGGALAYIATSFAGKVPVGINFMLSKEEQDYMKELCGVKAIFTSRNFIQKAGIPEDSRMVFIEEISGRTSNMQKTLTYLSCKLSSTRSLIQRFKRHDDPEKIAIILFTSGSESSPKGVPLTNYNVYTSIQSYRTVFEPLYDDVILGTLPFFHVFGFTVCLWFPLIVGLGVVFHPNPTDYERIEAIVHKHHVTMLLGTSTLYRGFMKKWKREQISNIRRAFAGAEKLNQDIRERFYEKFGINILEGYGVTESCSCISVNRPDNFRHGSVGMILPGIQCKIVDIETYEELPPGKDGLILVKGPNLMKGYYKSPELTRQAFYNDFYITGDIGRFEDGFLYITDRLKRFAKIGGEMFPLSPIENKLSIILDENIDDEKRRCAVVNIPSPQKGEQLIAFVTGTNPDKLLLNAELERLGLAKLSQPDHYIPIDTIPILPSGKVDYKQLKQLAQGAIQQD